MNETRRQRNKKLSVESELLDSNGRPFCFDSLFGNKIPSSKDFISHKISKEERVNQPRLSTCLSQLGGIVDDRDYRLEETKSYQHQAEIDSYIPGVSNPWSSIDYKVTNSEVTVSHRTRVDCGLPPSSTSSVSPSRRQQRMLDAAFEVDLYEERSKVVSEKSAVFVEKSRELEQRRQGKSSKSPQRPRLAKKDSALSLNYLS